MKKLLKTTWKEFKDDNAMTHAAALAFYALLSLIPFLSLVLLIVRIFMRGEAASNQILGFVEDFVGKNVADILGAMFERSESYGGRASSIMGIVVLLIGATVLVGHLQRGLNHMFDVEERQMATKEKVKTFFKTKGKLLLTVVAVAVAVIGLLIVSFALSYVVRTVGAPSWLFDLLHYAAAFAIVYFFITYLFMFVPDAKLTFKQIRGGSLVTTILFIVGQVAIGIYFRYSQTEQMYGFMASIILFVLWVYYSAMVLYFGAELTHVWAKDRGDKP
ncbi:MAG: YihY/virulence factor BrkB family protein [Phycisphaerae bacterium]|nr:YihY/virulence factor BrkB family protein [Phycisphaerae bacterium]